MKKIIFLFLFFSQLVLGKCPDGFVKVPANKKLLVNKPFCVMKFSAKAESFNEKRIEMLGCSQMDCKKKNWARLYDEKTGGEGYRPISVPQGLPWRAIDFETAKKACSNLGKGYALINNYEWMTIANNIEGVDENWSGNKVGVGFLNRGHSDGSPDHPCDSSLENIDKDCSTQGKDFHQKRTHKLSNGEIIWDIAGNTWEWVDWKVSFGKKAAPADAWVEFSRLRPEIETGKKMNKNMFTSLNNPHYSSRQNIGKYWSESPKTSESVAIRGARWRHNQDSGIYALDLSVDPKLGGKTIAFRCVKR